MVPRTSFKIIKVELSLDRKPNYSAKLSRSRPVPAFDFRTRSNPKSHRDHRTTRARLVYSAAAKILSLSAPSPTFSSAIYRCRRRNSLTRNRPLMYESCSNRNLFGIVTRRTWNFSVWYLSFLWHSARTRPGGGGGYGGTLTSSVRLRVTPCRRRRRRREGCALIQSAARPMLRRDNCVSLPRRRNDRIW